MCAFIAMCAAAAFAADAPRAIQKAAWNNAPPFEASGSPPSADGAGHPSLAAPSTVAPAVMPPPMIVEAPAPVTFDAASEPSWHLHVGAVYLQPRWPDMELGIANRQNLGVPNGQVQRLEFDPALGFEAGFERRFNANSGFRMHYTYLHAETQTGIAANPGATVTPTLTHPLGMRDVDGGLGSARHTSNVLDVLWTRRIHSADCFDVWLLAGPRAAWLRRGFDLDYTGGDAGPLGTADHNQSFRGFGLCGGFDLEWKLGGGWSVEAGSKLSLLKSRNRMSVLETSLRGQALLADANDARSGITPMFDMNAGLKYAVGAWNVAAGYQMQQWFSVSELLTFNDDVHVGSLDRRRGDLSLDGLYLRLGVSF